MTATTATATTARKIFSKSRSRRRGRFRQIFVEIGAILAIFRQFEVFGSGRPDARTSGRPSVRTSERPSVEASERPMERPNVRVSGLDLERTQSTPDAEYWKTPLQLQFVDNVPGAITEEHSSAAKAAL